MQTQAYLGLGFLVFLLGRVDSGSLISSSSLNLTFLERGVLKLSPSFSGTPSESEVTPEIVVPAETSPSGTEGGGGVPERGKEGGGGGGGGVT